MTITVSGNVGTRFNVSVEDTSNNTGSSTVNYSIEASVGDLTLTNADKFVAFYGNIGITAVSIDLMALQYLTGADYKVYPVVATIPVVLSNVKAIYIHNKHVSQTLTAYVAAATSFLPASEQITIQPGASSVVYNGPAIAITGLNNLFRLIASGLTTDFEMYIVGS